MTAKQTPLPALHLLTQSCRLNSTLHKIVTWPQALKV